jgi:hypothetical protein
LGMVLALKSKYILWNRVLNKISQCWSIDVCDEFSAP